MRIARATDPSGNRAKDGSAPPRRNTPRTPISATGRELRQVRVDAAVPIWRTLPTYPDPVSTPADVLAALVRGDPGVPRLTWYDDDAGERIELSAAVLANWVAKAANLLQDDADAAPGTTVRLALPPHWRSVYWALAAWSVGATLVLGAADGPCDVLVGSQARETGAHDGYAVHVTFAALARSNPETPPGVVDEARELATYGDRFEAYAHASPDDPALVVSGAVTAYRDLVETRDWPAQPRVRVVGDLDRVLRDSLAAWALGGSVVLIAHPGAEQAARADVRTGHRRPGLPLTQVDVKPHSSLIWNRDALRHW